MPGSTRITVHPAICDGQPTVRGLRVPVWQVLDWLATLKPSCRFARSQASDHESEAWLLSRQSQWLAKQEFLKQLRQRRTVGGQSVN